MGSGLVDTTASSAAGVGRDVVAATVATVTVRGPEPHDANPLPELEPGTCSGEGTVLAKPREGEQAEFSQFSPAQPG